MTGAAAFSKSVLRRWSPSIIKSALMTSVSKLTSCFILLLIYALERKRTNTYRVMFFYHSSATTYSNTRKPPTNSSNYFGNPHDMGAGEINPLRALNPGLVFETTAKDYLLFLCYYGYSQRNIRSMSKTNFSCPRNATEDPISNINYPSISIKMLNKHQGAKVIRRTVTNMGSLNATYTARVIAPEALVVKVFPNKLVFAEGIKRMSYEVSFYGKEAHSGYNLGSLTWLDGRHYVHNIFAVNVE